MLKLHCMADNVCLILATLSTMSNTVFFFCLVRPSLEKKTKKNVQRFAMFLKRQLTAPRACAKKGQQNMALYSVFGGRKR